MNTSLRVLTAVAALWCGLTQAAAQAAGPTPEGLLLYASFDGQGYESLEPRVRDVRRRGLSPVLGRLGHYPVADVAAGDPLPLLQGIGAVG